MDQNFSISHTTKRKPPRLRFAQIKKTALGTTYDLSLVFVGIQKIQTLNRMYRNKDYATDILSFPVTDSMGEIYICKEIADKKAGGFGRGKNNYLEFIFIHGCVHLLGYDHGNKMEELEKKYRKKFKI